MAKFILDVQNDFEVHPVGTVRKLEEEVERLASQRDVIKYLCEKMAKAHKDFAEATAEFESVKNKID